MSQNRRWRRTQSLEHQWKIVHADDWTLAADDGEFLGRIHDTGDDDLLGSWRWWVAPFFKVENVGSAQSGAEAKRIVEERLAARELEVD